MNRLKECFDKLKEKNKKAFSTFLMAGYPNYPVTLEYMHMCVEEEVNFLEIGMPFSDPSADGPIIKETGAYSLKKHATVEKTFELIRKFREFDKKTPIVWMGYFNPIFNYGIERFLAQCASDGVDGLLIVDLPIEEQWRISRASKYGIDIIRMITPTTSNERIEKILKDASGFIYFVSIAGITGTKEAQEEKIKSRVEYIKSKTDLPVMVGFGIKNPQKADKINTFADGVIVGSALTRTIERFIMDNDEILNKVTMVTESAKFIRTFTHKKYGREYYF